MHWWNQPDLLNRLAATISFVVVGSTLYFGSHHLAALPLFNFQRIILRGELRHLSKIDLERVIRHDLRGNFLTMDLATTQAAIAALPWIRTVTIRRRWPESLEIEITEHDPLAHWSHGGLVNQQGEVFSATYNEVLPELEGPPGSELQLTQTYRQITQLVKPLAVIPERLKMSPRRAWSLLLSNGLTIELGREEILNRLQRFVTVYPYTMARLFSNSQRPLRQVDLRYPNGFTAENPQGSKIEHSINAPTNLSIKKASNAARKKSVH